MTQRTLATDVPVAPAATVMLLRDGADGVEVLMLQRTFSAAFARGNYVFPGGRVDDADHAGQLEAICAGETDVSASARLGLDRGGLAWLVAAIRECFEEAGVLLAAPIDALTTADLVQARQALHAGELDLSAWCTANRLGLLTSRLHYVAHWLTPLGERRRFDTRFFLAAAPADQEALHDAAETIASTWLRPADGLAAWAAKELMMFPPTVACLRWLQDHATVAAAVEAAARLPMPERITPRLVLSGDERVVGVRTPGDADFDDTPIPRFVIGHPR